MISVFKQLLLVFLVIFSGNMSAGTAVFSLVTLSGPGSQSDTAVRFLAADLEAALGQRVIVVNAPGAEGVVGMRDFMGAHTQCDGMLVGNASVMFASLHKKQLGFDAMKEFVPIHGLANTNGVIVVPATSDVFNLKDLQAKFRKDQRLIAGSISPATTTSLGMLDTSMSVQTDIINYKTTPQMLQDLVGGRLDYSIVLPGTSAIQGLIDSNRLRIIAGAERKRHPAYPSVKTIAEQGFKPIEVFYWSGFFVNNETSLACRKKLEGLVRTVLSSDTGDRYSQLAGAPQRLMLGSKEMGALIHRQLELIESLQN